MEEFCSIFKNKRKVINVKNGFLLKVLERVIIPFFYLLFVSTGLITSIIEKDGIEKKRIGKISSIKWIEGYFQKSGKISDSLVPEISLHERFIEEAHRFLEKHNIVGEFAFAHIRRGDYLNFYVLGKKDPSLPVSFYLNGLSRIGFSAGDIPLVILGDDPAFANDFFYNEGWNTVISDLSPAGDFALMTLASGGVISNSTFAWWAGKLSEKKIAAPLYWLGWKSKQWYPKEIKGDDFIWVEV